MSASANLAVAPSVVDEFNESIKVVVALQKFIETGHVFTTNKINLNDASSAEYVISVVKHVYKGWVIV